MKTFAIFNVKGGVGKTTSATAIAHLLAAEHGRRVLLADLDPQSNTSSLFGRREADIVRIITSVFLDNDLGALRQFEHTVGELLTDPGADVRAAISPTRYPGLDLLPAFLDLSEVEERLKADITAPQQFRLRNHLEKVSGDYDYCILDLSPSINLININGLAAADWVLSPMRLDLWGVAGYCIAKNLIDTVTAYNPKLAIAGCFFVQWENKSVARQIRDLMKQAMGERYIDIPIRKSVKAEEMTYAGQALADYAPAATASEDYRRLVRYLLKKF